MAFDLRLSERQYRQLMTILNHAAHSHTNASKVAMDLRDYIHSQHPESTKENHSE